MLTATDTVLRTVIDAALDGQRSWKNVGDLAWKAGVGDKIAYKALAKPTSIGAITRHAGGGFSVTDPERLLAIFSARRSLKPVKSTTFDAAQELLPSLPEYAIGGSRAAVHHLGGTNTVADHAPTIIYLPEALELGDLPPGGDALLLAADARSLLSWADGYTSKAQTYADLFAQPGWQASEFRRELWRAWFSVDDWARAEASSV